MKEGQKNRQFKEFQKGKKIKQFKQYFVTFVTIYTFVTFVTVAAYAGIAGTKHDLSAAGPGPIKAITETQKCVFCHTPHHAGGVSPLWNRDLSTTPTYIVPSPSQPEWASLLSGEGQPVGQPDRGAKLCLSCHDGAVAIGLLINTPGTGTTYPTPISMLGVTAEGKMPCSPIDFTCLGTDISGHHPVSIAYNDSLYNDKTTQYNDGLTAFSLKPPASVIPPVRLKPTDNKYKGAGVLGVQCSSCHNPHNNPYGNFLVIDYYANSMDLCCACHGGMLCE